MDARAGSGRKSGAVATLVCVLFTGCFQPVDPNAKVVSSCTGSCPYGACDEGCAAAADAGCATPEDCLKAYSCQRTGSSRTCSAYTNDNFNIADGGTSCAATPGSYCAETIGAYGAKRTVAVSCTDAGTTVSECNGPSDPCDGGAPPECWPCQRKQYCIH